MLTMGGFLAMNNLTRWVFATLMQDVKVASAKDFSETSMKYALENPSSVLPRPFGGGFLVVSMIVSDGFNDEMKDWVKGDSLRREFAAVGCTMLLSLDRHEAYSSNQPPLVGRAFFGEVKKIRDICMKF